MAQAFQPASDPGVPRPAILRVLPGREAAATASGEGGGAGEGLAPQRRRQFLPQALGGACFVTQRRFPRPPRTSGFGLLSGLRAAVFGFLPLVPVSPKPSRSYPQPFVRPG